MAWIEDAEQRVLLVRQALGLRLWTLPGGKVKRGESLVKALRRELYEETGLRAQIGSLLGVLDRRDKDAIIIPGQKTPQSIQQSALLSPGPERSSFFLSFPSEP
jgi:ADP-ribose pyrophosphatase YjhB (NUDIX family)